MYEYRVYSSCFCFLFVLHLHFCFENDFLRWFVAKISIEKRGEGEGLIGICTYISFHVFNEQETLSRGYSGKF